jgi:Domain of unknown function (DUF4340)
MNRWIRWLAALLALQLVLGVVLHFSGNRLSAAPAAGAPLLAAAPDDADHLTIEGPDGKKVVLQKQAGNWLLPDESGFPADANKVKELFTHLAAVKTGPMVSKTHESRERFKVADDGFERRVTLAAGDKTLARIYLGDAPSPRQVHLRRDGENAVYDVDLGTWEFPVDPAAWEDKGVLHLAQQDIRSVEAGGLMLTHAAAPATTAADVAKPAAAKPAPGWQAAQGLKKGETLNASAADTLAQRIANLDIGSVLGRADQPEYGLANPQLQLAVTRADGHRIEYRLGRMSKGQDYALKSSARDEYFQLPEATAHELIDAAKHESLVQASAGGKK